MQKYHMTERTHVPRRPCWSLILASIIVLFWTFLLLLILLSSGSCWWYFCQWCHHNWFCSWDHFCGQFNPCQIKGWQTWQDRAAAFVRQKGRFHQDELQGLQVCSSTPPTCHSCASLCAQLIFFPTLLSWQPPTIGDLSRIPQGRDSPGMSPWRGKDLEGWLSAAPSAPRGRASWCWRCRCRPRPRTPPSSGRGSGIRRTFHCQSFQQFPPAE